MKPFFKPFIVSLIIFLTLVGSSVFVFGGTIDDAWDYYILGTMYANGRGVARDDEEAVRWFRKAADQGDANARYALGRCYLLGKGVGQDIDAARGLFMKAAESGFDDAQQGIVLTASRGYLRSALNVRSGNGNVIVARNKYVIFLPGKKQLLYPYKGTFTQVPDVTEGKDVTVETEVKKSKDMADVHIRFKTDFLIKKLLLDGASITFDDMEPSDTPKFIKSKASFNVSVSDLARGFSMKLISRENTEHLRRLEYRDGALKVVSSRDMANF